jgi:Tryptophan-associated transmembrane protein (Trp_oprn_chp)
MTDVSTRGAGRATGELAAVLISGAAGAGAALLATRQALASVIVRAPSPLPDTVRAVIVQDVRPAGPALAVAALASLAAVLATRGVLRRLTGLITVTLGAGLAVIAAGPVTVAAVLAAAGRAGTSPASGAGAGTAAGSVTAGNGAAPPPGSIGGFPVHVVLGGTGWRVLMIVGAVLIAAAGVAVMARASHLPVMSGRYDRQARRRGAGVQAAGSTTAGSTATGSATAAGTRAGGTRAGSMWEALSAGSDPTAGPD